MVSPAGRPQARGSAARRATARRVHRQHRRHAEGAGCALARSMTGKQGSCVPSTQAGVVGGADAARDLRADPLPLRLAGTPAATGRRARSRSAPTPSSTCATRRTARGVNPSAIPRSSAAADKRGTPPFAMAAEAEAQRPTLVACRWGRSRRLRSSVKTSTAPAPSSPMAARAPSPSARSAAPAGSVLAGPPRPRAARRRGRRDRSTAAPRRRPRPATRRRPVETRARPRGFRAGDAARTMSPRCSLRRLRRPAGRPGQPTTTTLSSISVA